MEASIPSALGALLLLLPGCAMKNDVQSPREAGSPDPSEAAVRPDQAPELGLVRWGRDHERAFELSRADGKPVLLLFQEIPG